MGTYCPDPSRALSTPAKDPQMCYWGRRLSGTGAVDEPSTDNGQFRVDDAGAATPQTTSYLLDPLPGG